MKTRDAEGNAFALTNMRREWLDKTNGLPKALSR
jgi:hypothetical protein